MGRVFEKGLSLAAILVATNSLPHNVCGLLLAVRGVQSTGQSLRRLLKMPIPYAILAALLFRIFNFSLPSSVFDPIDIFDFFQISRPTQSSWLSRSNLVQPR